ncbi:MAG: TIGR00159 family protein, partial [Lachnospiraceae bacterium]|nr:TIGR00159 family protein [Lachnospiraceae bacterium]
VVIRGNRVAAATCYLPLSDNLTISKDLGTRHRAALGISETSDSMTVIVSEETGRVTLARDGKLTRFEDPELLRAELHVESKTDVNAGRFKFWKGRRKHERKNE